MGRGICAVVAMLLALLVPLTKWAVPRLLNLDLQPPATQKRWQPRRSPSIQMNDVKGLPAPSFVTDERLNFLEHNFTHRPGDVWVTTYAKVGSTWTQYIVCQILGYPIVNGTLELFDFSPWVEVAHGIIGISEEALQSTTAWNRTRVLKSHWPRTSYMENLPNSSKVIYVYRDVERVAVSFWHHILNAFFSYWTEPEDLPWDVYFEKFIAGDMEFGDYFEHVASWWKMRGAPNVLFIRFEELKHEPRVMVRRIAAFVGVELDDARVDEVVEATSLKSMKRWTESMTDRFLKFTGAFRGDHIRGGQKEELLTASQRSRLEERFDTVLKPLGVPYEHFFVSAAGGRCH